MGRSLSPTNILSICEGGAFEKLKGIIETAEFEFKQSPYRLGEENQKRELAKDISGLANAGGGIILLGAKAALQGPTPQYGEEIDETSPFSTDLFDEKQYRDTLKSWIYPNLAGVSFQLHPCATKPRYCVVTISVPKADPSIWPVLVMRPIVAEGKVSGAIFGFFQRRDADVDPTRIERLHALLRAGIDAEPARNKLAGMEDILAELLGRSEQIGKFAEYQNRRRAQIDKKQHQKVMRPVFAREIGEALANSGLQDEPHIMLAVYPPDGSDLSNLMNRSGPPIPNPPEIRHSGFDLNMREFSEVRTRDTRRFLTPAYKLREISRFGLIAAVQKGNNWFLSWDLNKTQDSPYRINPLALAEFSYLFSLFAKQVLEFAAEKPESLECRVRLGNMGVGGQPPRLKPVVLNVVSLQEELIAPSYELDESFEVLGETSPGRMAYEFVNHVYMWFGANGPIPYSRDTGEGPVIDQGSILLR